PACRRPGVLLSSRTSYRKRMRSLSLEQRRRAPFCSARPTCRWALAIFRATTTSTERPTTRGTSVAPPGAPQADRQRRLQRPLAGYRWDRTSADRCACRRSLVVFTLKNRVLV